MVYLYVTKKWSALTESDGHFHFPFGVMQFKAVDCHGAERVHHGALGRSWNVIKRAYTIVTI